MDRNTERPLISELLSWKATRDVPLLWWRDDDAFADTPGLRPLLHSYYLPPVLLAVIPCDLRADLLSQLTKANRVEVCQHGWAHKNHAGPNQRPAEFTSHRSLALMKSEIRTGFEVLECAFGNLFQPIFAPPWHALPANLSGELSSLGFDILSTESRRSLVGHETWIARAPIHVDLCDWKWQGAFIGREAAYSVITRKLAASRVYDYGNVPIGILSHHGQMAPDFIEFMAELFQLTSEYGARWLRGSELSSFTRCLPTTAAIS